MDLRPGGASPYKTLLSTHPPPPPPVVVDASSSQKAENKGVEVSKCWLRRETFIVVHFKVVTHYECSSLYKPEACCTV